MAQSEILVVLAKEPVPRKTKTRLSSNLNAREAAELYTCFLADTLMEAASVSGVDHLIGYDPPQARDYFTGLAPEFLLLEQKGPGLGERMQHAFATLLSSGYRRMVLIGSDLPHIPGYIYKQGFEALHRGADIVLGPCADGGYFLIGLTQPHPELFGFQMSTPVVLRKTIESARFSGLQVELLPDNFDVDTFGDLLKLGKLLSNSPEIRALSTRAWMKAHSLLFDLEK